MKLNITVELDNFYDETMTLEEILTDEVKAAVVREVSKKFSKNGVKEMSAAISSRVEDQIADYMRAKAEGFMSEDIALTDNWGKTTFIGSIEDFMKLKFDETVLHPVDHKGDFLKACTSSGGNTWIQWRIEKLIKEKLESEARAAKNQIERSIKNHIEKELETHKTSTIKAEVAKAIEGLLKPAA